jgi:hypothetical protein
MRKERRNGKSGEREKQGKRAYQTVREKFVRQSGMRTRSK